MAPSFFSDVKFTCYSFLHLYPQTKTTAAYSSLSSPCLSSSGGAALHCLFPQRTFLHPIRLPAQFSPTSAGGKRTNHPGSTQHWKCSCTRESPLLSEIPLTSEMQGHQGSLPAWSPEGLFSSTSSTNY